MLGLTRWKCAKPVNFWDEHTTTEAYSPVCLNAAGPSVLARFAAGSPRISAANTRAKPKGSLSKVSWTALACCSAAAARSASAAARRLAASSLV